MKLRKTIVLVIVIISLLLVSVACQRNNAKQETKGKAPDKGLPAKLDNPNLRILTWGNNENNAMMQKEEAVKEFERKYGGKVEYTLLAAGNALREKLVTSVTSGDYYDVVFWRYDDMPLYAIKGLLQPLDELFDFNEPFLAERKSAIDQFRWLGKCYGLPEESGVFLIFFNKTLFEQSGVKTPLEHYNEGKWNWETFRQTAKSLTLDLNNDGIIDQWGISSQRNADFLMLGNNSDLITWDKDGDIQLSVKEPATVEALQFFQDLFVKDKCMPLQINITTAFPEGKLAMVAATSNYFYRPIHDSKMKYEWNIAPTPTAPFGSKTLSAGVFTFQGIVNGAYNTEAARAFLYIDNKLRMENEEAEMEKYYTKEQVKLIKELLKDVRIPKYDGVGNMRKVVNPFFNAIKKGEPVMTVIEKNIPLFEEEIKLMLNEAK